MKPNEKIVITPSKCPFCNSAEVLTYKPPSTQDSLATNFRIIADNTCKQCNGIWSPPTPRWLAVFTVLLGAAMLVAGLGSFAFNLSAPGSAQRIYHDLGKGLLCFIAFGILIAGIRSIRAKANEGVVRTLPRTTT